MTEPEQNLHAADHHASDESVEPEGLDARMVGVIVVGGIVLIVALMLAAVQMTGLVFQEAVTESTEFTGYPTLEQTRSEAEQLMTTYAPIDRNAGIYRIPVDRAMELIVQEAAEAGGN